MAKPPRKSEKLGLRKCAQHCDIIVQSCSTKVIILSIKTTKIFTGYFEACMRILVQTGKAASRVLQHHACKSQRSDCYDVLRNIIGLRGRKNYERMCRVAPN